MIKFLMEFLRILLTVTRPISFWVLDAIYRIIYGAKPVLPIIDDKILLLPATELAKKIRLRQLKAENVMKIYIKRIKQMEPFINACVDQRFEEAMKEAIQVDRFLSRGAKSTEEIGRDTPLLGVPFSCKESLGVKGLAQTCGIYAAKSRKAPQDGVATSLYRSAGAIPVVVTNVPEFCTWWDSESVPFGTTFNPYDNRRCAGGSSGGEGAILAYAGSVIGIGNDLAGSIRMPAAFNGIYGHKPSPGMISNIGFWPSSEGELPEIDRFVGTGPMCRYAQDLPLLATILSENRITFERKVDFRKLKIYYMEQFPGYLLKPIPDVRAATQKTIHSERMSASVVDGHTDTETIYFALHLFCKSPMKRPQAVSYFKETFNARPTKLNIPELKYATEIWESKLLEGGIPPFREVIVKPGQKVNILMELLKNISGYREHTIQAIYFSAINRRKKDADYHKFIAMFDVLKKKLDEVLEGDALLLIPTHPEPAPHHLMTIPKYPNVAYTCIFNVLGYPSTQIPAGFSNRLPIGIQAIAAIDNDFLCLATAVELDKIFGGWKCPN